MTDASVTPVPTVADRAAQPYVGITKTVTMATIPEIADQIPQLLGAMARQGLAPAGAPFLRYKIIDMDRELVIEAGVPVDAGSVAPEGAAAGALPAGRYAVVVHHGHPDGLVDATSGLLDWANGEGHAWDVQDTAAGEVWGCRLESYLTDPRDEPDMNAWDTELAFRLAD